MDTCIVCGKLVASLATHAESCIGTDPCVPRYRKNKRTIEQVFYHVPVKMRNDVIVESERAMAIVFTGDWHVGNDATNHIALLNDLNILKQLDVKVVLMGDLIDNYIPEAPTGGAHDAILRPRDQKRLVMELVKMFEEDKILAVISGCFLPGTTVTDETGCQVPIESATCVLGRHTAHEVNTSSERLYDGKVHEIKVFGNNAWPIVSTAEHPFDVVPIENVRCKAREHGRACHGDASGGKYCEKRCTGKPWFGVEKVSASDIRPGDFLVIDIPDSDHCMSTIHPDVMEFLGWYAAEGHVVPKSKMVGLTLGHTEGDVADFVQRVVREHFGVTCRRHDRPDRHTIDLTMTDQALCNFVMEHVGRYSDHKRLSGTLVAQDNTLMRRFIDGITKGDGHVRDGYMCYTTVSPHLASQVYHLLLRLGKFATIRKVGSRPNRKQAYEVHYMVDEHRQKPRFIRIGNKFLVRVKSNKARDYSGPVYNIEVNSQDHVYRVGGVTVHNCHEEWSVKQDDFEFADYISEAIDKTNMRFGGIIRAVVGKNTYHIGASHKYPGGYKNELGPPKEFFRNIGPVDIVAQGHVHKPFQGQFILQGRFVHAVTCGSYKEEDRHVMRMHLMASVPTMPCVILYPGERKIASFLDFKDALPELQRLSLVSSALVPLIDKQVEHETAPSARTSEHGERGTDEVEWKCNSSSVDETGDNTMNVSPMLHLSTKETGKDEIPVNLATDVVNVGNDTAEQEEAAAKKYRRKKRKEPVGQGEKGQ